MTFQINYGDTDIYMKSELCIMHNFKLKEIIFLF